MNNFVAQILSIQLSLTGATRIQAWLNRIADQFNLTAVQVNVLSRALSVLGVAFGFLAVGTSQAGSSQSILARLTGFVGDARIAANQLAKINELSSQGLFNRSEWAGAVEMMDKSNLSLSKNLKVMEALAVRMHSLSGASNLITKIEGAAPGAIPRITESLLQAGITPEQLMQHGVKVVNRTVLSGKENLMRALREIAENDPVAKYLSSTLEARLRGLRFQAERFAESFGPPLLKGITRIVEKMADLLGWMKDLNNATGGWVGHFAIGGALIVGLRTAAAQMLFIRIQTMLAAIWAGAHAAASWLLNGGLTAALRVLFSMRTIHAFHAVLAAAWAAAMGNFVPLAILAGAIAITTGLVWGMDKIVDNYRKREEGKINQYGIDRPGSHADRPVRHDDVENMYKRLHGWGWTG